MEKLIGTVLDDRWSFHQNGIKHSKTDAIFPIFTIEDGIHQLIGTGFYISENGLFMTARHVVMHVCNAHFQEEKPIYILHLRNDNTYLMRPVISAWSSNEADVSIGVAAPMSKPNTGEPLMNSCLTLTDKIPNLGTHVVTYAFPNFESQNIDKVQHVTLSPAFYDGKITDYHKVALGGGPAYQTDIHIHAGASGGPVIDFLTGCVFGINSSSFQNETDISFVAPIGPAFKAKIENVQIEGYDPPTRMEDLIKLGYITVK